MIELLAPAGSPEGVMAAVQNGADAVYLGFGDYNARRNAKNFTEEDFARAAEYCRVRGVKVYVTLNTLAGDKELQRVAVMGRRAWQLGADAVLVQDLGVARALRQACPDMPLHASTQMTLHTIEGIRLAADMGLKRVVVSRELSREDLTYLCAESPIELEVFVHGALCMCWSGQCYMSSVIGRRSGNRGLCAQPCRMPYSHAGRGTDYPMSLKDNCLIRYVEELENMGVASLKIEGRMRRPEYAAIVTGIYSRAIREHRPPTQEELSALLHAFSRDGFTDGYYTGQIGNDMFGIRKEEEKRETAIFATAKRNYLNGEFQRVPVRFLAKVEAGKPMKLIAADDRGNCAAAAGETPEPAFHKPLTVTSLQTQLYKTGGTPFMCEGVKSKVDDNLALSMSAVNALRRQVLTDLLQQRKALPERQVAGFSPAPAIPGPETAPAMTMSVLHCSQLSPELAKRKPKVLYYPLEETLSGAKALQPFLADPDIEVCAVMPRVFKDSQRSQIDPMLDAAKELGVKTVLVGNLGHIRPAQKAGFGVRGDFGLNIYNSDAMSVLRELNLLSATVSFELRWSAIRQLSKCVPAEAIVYGRLPLMITENCIVKASLGRCGCETFDGITDRTGATFPVVKAFGCRSVVLNSQKLYLADRRQDFIHAGLWAARLMFTTENPRECVEVTDAYLGDRADLPGNFTRGLYYRGVE